MDPLEEHLTNITRRPGRASWIQIVTSRHDQASRDQAVRDRFHHADLAHLLGQQRADACIGRGGKQAAEQ